jgi:hypothetical protein
MLKQDNISVKKVIMISYTLQQSAKYHLYSSRTFCFLCLCYPPGPMYKLRKCGKSNYGVVVKAILESDISYHLWGVNCKFPF